MRSSITEMEGTMISERLRRLTPYTAGEQPRGNGFIKLNTNENPYPPAPAVSAALESFDPGRLRLYPDPACTELREAVAESLGLSPENVFAGNGSDEVLSFAFYAFFDGARGPLLMPQFTYSFYPVYCDFYGIPYRRLPLRPDFSLDLSAYLESGEACGIAFANPNAPTGVAASRSEIERLLARAPADRVILVDEAYVDYGGESVVPLIREHENLLVVYTFSKSKALAGMRLGFAYGSRALVDALFAVKDSFNSYPIDTLAQAVGAAAARAGDYYAEVTRRVVATRRAFSDALLERGATVLPSSANFVFASFPGLSGRTVYGRLKERGILVRHFEIPGISDFVRISMGTEEQMGVFLGEIDKWMKHAS